MVTYTGESKVSKTHKQERQYRKERSGIVLGMILSGKVTQVMRDRRDRRSKDARKSWQNEQW